MPDRHDRRDLPDQLAAAAQAGRVVPLARVAQAVQVGPFQPMAQLVQVAPNRDHVVIHAPTPVWNGRNVQRLAALSATVQVAIARARRVVQMVIGAPAAAPATRDRPVAMVAADRRDPANEPVAIRALRRVVSRSR